MVYSDAESEEELVSRKYGSFSPSSRDSIHVQNLFRRRSRLISTSIAFAVCSVCLFGVFLSSRSTVTTLLSGSQFSMVDLSAEQRTMGGGPSGAPNLRDVSAQRLFPGHVLHIDMPMSQMDKLKVGSVVKGHVRLPMLANDEQHVGNEFNSVPFTGEVGKQRFRSLSILLQ